MTVSKYLIGEGGNSKVYKIKCNPVQIGSEFYSQMILKEFKCGQCAVERYLMNYLIAKDTGMPTLKFCLEADELFPDFDGIICEDLSADSQYLHVSPNTPGRSEPGETEKALAELTGRNLLAVSEAEAALVKKNITTVENLDSFMDYLISDVRRFSDKAFASEDSFFFGVEIVDEHIIRMRDYVIADLDTLCECDDSDPDAQEKAALIALCEFCHWFVSDSKYEKTVSDRLSLLV